MGYSQHAGVVIVADGTEAAARRLRAVCWSRRGLAVMRHADAGYENRDRLRRRNGLKLPMVARDGFSDHRTGPLEARGPATLWQAHWPVSLAAEAWAAIDASSQAGSAHRRARDAAYGNQHGFGLLAKETHSRRRAAATAAQPDPVALVGNRRVYSATTWYGSRW